MAQATQRQALEDDARRHHDVSLRGPTSRSGPRCEDRPEIEPAGVRPTGGDHPEVAASIVDLFEQA